MHNVQLMLGFCHHQHPFLRTHQNFAVVWPAHRLHIKLPVNSGSTAFVVISCLQPDGRVPCCDRERGFGMANVAAAICWTIFVIVIVAVYS